MKKLRELYEIDSDVLVKDIKINSKQVGKNDIFVCTMGVSADRHEYITEAVDNGASCVVVSKDVSENRVPIIKVENTNDELTYLAKRLYDYDDSLVLFAVTGTNGKTTVAKVIQEIIGDDLCGNIGTNGVKCKNFYKKTQNTTPDADLLYKYLLEFKQRNCKYVSMETSSEAFFRKRLVGLKFDVAIFTNITQDHLNIHKTLENYISCKLDLLNHMKEDGIVILNKDDKYYDLEIKNVKNKVLTYGMKDADLIIKNIEFIDSMMKFTFSFMSKDYVVKTHLLGEFNAYNLSAIILALYSKGYKIDEIVKKIEDIKPVSGRVDLIDYNQNYKILLDYAHTPDAFNNIFDLVKKIDHNKVITVTGSAGGREQEKRPIMGSIALENSDIVIFTMDDPRNEDVSSIIDDLIGDSKKDNYYRTIDRKDAIFKALSLAKKDDIVLILGKGTDEYMAIKDDKIFYSDLNSIKEYFEKNETLQKY